MSSKKIILIGDIMIDNWFYGEVNRMSPEDPSSPVFEIKDVKSSLGGAGNVFLSLNKLFPKNEGNDVVFLTVSGISNDIQNIPYEEISNIQFLGISEGITTKNRYVDVSSGKQYMRIDKDVILKDIDVNPYLIPILKSSFKDVSLCVISDYGKGNITQRLMKDVRRNTTFVVDPKCENWNIYMGAYAITPNFKEFMEAVHYTFGVWANTNIANRKEFFPSIIEYAKKLMIFYDFEEMVLKLSENGIIYFWNGGKDHIHGYSLVENLVDVTGAGDCVIASYVKNIDQENKVVLLNKMLRAAKKCCETKGTYILTGDE